MPLVARTAQGVTAVNPGPAVPRYRQKPEPMSSYSQAAEAEIRSPRRSPHAHGRPSAPILLEHAAGIGETCMHGLYHLRYLWSWYVYEYVIYVVRGDAFTYCKFNFISKSTKKKKG